MNSINIVEKAGSDIENYVNSIEKIYNQQLEKINFMKLRLINFKKLLSEEAEISQKIMKMNEMMESVYGDSFSQSTFSKVDGVNKENDNIENIVDDEF